MKHKLNILIFFAAVFFLILPSCREVQAWDTTAAKFYPLQVGNVYVFDRISLWFNCNPFEFMAKYRVAITELVAKPNGKYYYGFSGWWLVGGYSKSWRYQRIDSASMNVYAYDSSSNTEFLLDSLLANQGNTFAGKRFNTQANSYATFGSLYTVSMFGETRWQRGHSATFFGGITAYYGITEGIGFTGYSSCELGSGSMYKIAGCIINGIRYGDTTLTSVVNVSSNEAGAFSISGIYPNPFNPECVINYSIPGSGNRGSSLVKITLYDALGKHVAELLNEFQTRGRYSVRFNGSAIPGGVYFVKLENSGKVLTEKIILLK